ncbi:MAG: FAD-binding protein [Vampirovibrionales bacterium]|nr:FAD-binding protein [Vampirovibrionales bacterium]
MAPESPAARLIPELSRMVGARFVLSQPSERAAYECDACVLIQAPPDVIVLPGSSEEAAAVVALCAQHGVPYTPRGAGTGLSGGALAIEGGVLIGMNRLRRILAIDVENRTATIQAGVVNARLNAALAGSGLFYAPDPSSMSACTLGGNLAENAGGIHCVKYGVTTDHVLSLRLVTSDGALVWTAPPGGCAHRRGGAGLNLTGLLVGSEGTMGLITEAIVKLTPVAPDIRAYLAAFDAVACAGEAVSAIIADGLAPAALEFMDAFTVRAVNEAFDVGFPENCQAVLLIELDGTPERATLQEARLRTLLQTHGARQIRSAQRDDERAEIWSARKRSVAAYGRYAPAFFVMDTVIPPSALVSLLDEIEAIARRHQLLIGNVFHAGDGNLHPNILFDPSDPDAARRVMLGGEEILKACVAAGGTLSGEHGVGLEKADYMSLVYSPADLARMQAVRQAVEPSGLANPGKIFPHRRACGETAGALAPAALNASGAWI